MKSLLFVGGADVPLLLIAIMTFILISSSGTMAMAVTSGYKKQRKKTAFLILLTALGGVAFVGMQMFEWTNLFLRCSVWGNPFGATQFGGSFHDHWLSRASRIDWCCLLTIVAKRVWEGRYTSLTGTKWLR